MPLMSHFAFDTETDRYEDGHIRTCLIQMCPINAVSLDNVVLIEGWDCYEQFFAKFEETGFDMDCHCYNLGGYEFDWFKGYLMENYEFTQTKGRLKPGQWTCVADSMTVYSVRVCNHLGKTLKFTDDMRRMGPGSMKKAAEAVRKSRPAWFEGMDKVKEDAEYNNGWFTDTGELHDEFIHYSKVDAYSQAMIAKYLSERGLSKRLTAASNGLEMALALRYKGKESWECDPQELYYARNDFKRDYPPLEREMQDIVEESLLGGFVWGEVGTHHGVFTHVDYSSSYPYEYAYGKLFSGQVFRLDRNNPRCKRILESGKFFRWYLVSFDFDLKDVGMPAISGRECRTVLNPMVGQLNKKMRTGHVHNRLYTETYFQELERHYTLTNVEIHEIWFAETEVGAFKCFIEKCYGEKSRPELKGTMDRDLWKLFMNGGVHGKTITKTHRKERVFYDGEEQLVPVVTDPEFCSLIGFTAMMNARERLLRHCRIVLENGGNVMMCDTDSMVINQSEEWITRVLGDWFVGESGSMEHSLGRFEMERDSEGRAEFDTFKCWGLKRYCEMINGKVRKTAFAGMHDEEQEEFLAEWETDGTQYEWTQTGKVKDKYGKIVCDVSKHMKAENVWYEENVTPKKVTGAERFDEILKKAKQNKVTIQEVRV